MKKTTKKPPRFKRGAEAAADILAAIERVAQKRTPSLPTVYAELLRTRRYGASFETILPVLRRWKMEALERASGRIEAAVDAVLGLGTKAERDEVRRLVELRSGGGIRVRIAARRISNKNGLPEKAVARHSPARRTDRRSTAERPPTGSKT